MDAVSVGRGSTYAGWLTLLALPVAAACDSAPGTTPVQPQSIIRDSAGIRIVEVPEGAFADLPQLTLAAEPDLEIGVREGDPDYQFAQIHDVTLMPDGGITVIEWSPMSIRYYDAEGSFIRAVGSQGRGPGDYRMPVELDPLPGDSLMVWDESVRRLTVLAPDGSVGRTIPVPWVGQDRYLSSVSGAAVMELRGVTVDQLHRSLSIVRLGPGGAVSDTLFTHLSPVVPVPPDFLPNAPIFAEPLWAPRASSGAAPGGVLVADGGPMEVMRLDADGQLREILRFGVQRAPVTDEFADWAVDSLASMDRDPDRARTWFTLGGIADSLPSIQDVQVGVDGRIWMGRYPDPPFPFQPPGKEFLVVEPDGTPVAWVSVPDRFSALEFGPDFVLGVGRDEFDVRYIRRYPLVPVREG